MPSLLLRNQILEDRRLPLNRPTVVVGRDQEADIRLEDPSISRFHARIELQHPDGPLLIDLGSSNGTFLNGERIDGEVSLEDGDHLCFGTVEVEFLEDQQVAAAAPAPAVAKARTTRPIFPALLAIVVMVACGLVAMKVLGEDDKPDVEPPHKEPTTETPKVQHPVTSHSTPTTEPNRPEVPTPEQPGDDPPPRRPVVPTPTMVKLGLKDGTTMEGIPVDLEHPILIKVRTPRGALRQVERERVATIDGVVLSTDLQKVYKARVANASSSEDLLKVCEWCAANGLDEERLKVARMIVEGDRDHVKANAILGRFRYLGDWSNRAELEATGAVDAHGRLVGTDDDLRQIRRAFLLLIGRTPTTSERQGALAVAPPTMLAELLASTDHWQSWLEDVLVRFLGEVEGSLLVESFLDLANDLASNDRSFQEAFVEVASCDAVRVMYPTSREFAERVLLVFIGPGAADDAARLNNATQMVDSERVALFGERGSSREDFLQIVSRQPAFFRTQLRHESKLIRGHDLERRELTRAAMQLAADPHQFHQIREQWFKESRKDEGVSRNMRPGTFARSLLVDAFDQLPSGDTGTLRSLLHHLSSPEAAWEALPVLFSLTSDFHVPPRDGQPDDAWIANQFRRILSRSPKPTELKAASMTLTQFGDRRLILDLLSSPEYRQL